MTCQQAIEAAMNHTVCSIMRDPGIKAFFESNLTIKEDSRLQVASILENLPTFETSINLQNLSVLEGKAIPEGSMRPKSLPVELFATATSLAALTVRPEDVVQLGEAILGRLMAEGTVWSPPVIELKPGG
jgi:hypothetical protein